MQDPCIHDGSPVGRHEGMIRMHVAVHRPVYVQTNFCQASQGTETRENLLCSVQPLFGSAIVCHHVLQSQIFQTRDKLHG